MHDIVIRGGTIVDGTGAPAFQGDVALDGDRIVQVGGKAGPGKREVKAEGRLVTPGWVDVHTHYDGQATWDPVLAPSSWHGATTLVFGNCGVGFAPVRNEHQKALIEMMEGVEDIPGITLTEGLKWDWESFPEYLDALERLPRTIDIGAQVAHHPLRVYAMGERAIKREMATAEDIELMARLTEEALKAGAVGFTTSRTDQHKTLAGDLVPGRYAEHEELIAIGKAMGRAGRGTFGFLSDFDDEKAEWNWVRQVARESGRPVWFLLTDRGYDPQRYKRLMEGVRACRADNLPLYAQVAGRPVGLTLGLNTSLNPFGLREGYAALAHLPPAEMLAKLRTPEVRRLILSQEASPRLLEVLPPLSRQIATRWDRMYPLGDKPDYEPAPERSIEALAKAEGVTPQEYCYDYLVGAENRMVYFPVTNYVHGDLEVVRELIEDPHTILGLSDGGAHCGVICDASLNSSMLQHWVRDRTRGPRLGLEFVVKRMTSSTADFYGFKDRGRLQPGMKADVNVIDFDGLTLHSPKMIFDLPAGGRRLVQSVDGYDMTICSGTPIFEKGEETGARPGKLVRSTA
ncbi:amidohydrolase family protein [Reyranella sp. MMS21-HV4-11]|uniref:Amidohydrolase family protein n=1 Tax=Reyranella humidisoli TaxID=2849149 RepID=A0ABS6IJ45_9HYPH|nr:amidohydrolase family protein [Reyranella sp. MMS21-HV4-11]MBU8874450.1 amidohydrolase family protein [Reyranella sp. MMS21-HV4-11]